MSRCSNWGRENGGAFALVRYLDIVVIIVEKPWGQTGLNVRLALVFTYASDAGPPSNMPSI